MTPKEKAVQLFNKYYVLILEIDHDLSQEIIISILAKKQALIAVDEIIETLNKDIRDIDVVGNILLDLIDYWIDVKTELSIL